VIEAGSAKVIEAGSAKVIATGSAKVIRCGQPGTGWPAWRLRADQSIRGRRAVLTVLSSGTRKDDRSMSAKGVSMHRLQELVRLHRFGGATTHEIAASLAMSPNTERKYRNALTAAGLLSGAVDALPPLAELKSAVEKALPAVEPPQQQSSITQWRNELKELLKKGLTPKAIHDRLRLKYPGDYTGKLGAVKRMVRRLRIEQGVSANDIAIPIETQPGHSAQVDFGYAGYRYDPETGVKRKAWAFVMVLGHSRHQYVEYVFDQKVETWIKLHINAFKELGAVPGEIVPDNLKAAVLKAAFSSSEDTTLNRSYRELARYYGFKVAPTPPRAPKKKGKVESGVKYVNRNFGKGRDGEDITTSNAEVRRWVREIAGTRLHGSTGRAPLEVFEQEERAALLPLPTEAYRVVTWHKATLHQDSHFHFDGRLYSVPWRHVAPQGKKATVVWARATATTVTAYIDDVRVADHDRLVLGRRSTREEHLPEHRRDYRHRDAAYWRDRAGQLGTEVRAYIDSVLDYDPVKSRVDIACACLRLLESVSPERAERVARHALSFGNVHYGELKRIVEQRLDQRDLADAPPVSEVWGDRQPVFARSGADYRERVDVRCGEALEEQPAWLISLSLGGQEVSRGTA
jgi:transposase